MGPSQGKVLEEWGCREAVSGGFWEVSANRLMLAPHCPSSHLSQFISKEKVENSLLSPRGYCSGCLELFLRVLDETE